MPLLGEMSVNRTILASNYLRTQLRPKYSHKVFELLPGKESVLKYFSSSCSSYVPYIYGLVVYIKDEEVEV